MALKFKIHLASSYMNPMNVGLPSEEGSIVDHPKALILWRE